MSESMLAGIIKDAIYTVLLISAPILAVSIIIGLLVSIFQATTQIQEQTLTFVPKLVGIAAVGLITGTWMLHTMVSFTDRIFNLISNVAK
jgi:flagellar biosynthetic protein FliQ